MVEIILGITIFLLIALLAGQEKSHQEERRRWTNTLIAKNAGELKLLEREEKPEKGEEAEPKQEAIPIEAVDNKTFMKAIEKGPEEEKNG